MYEYEKQHSTPISVSILNSSDRALCFCWRMCFMSALCFSFSAERSIVRLWRSCTLLMISPKLKQNTIAILQVTEQEPSMISDIQGVLICYFRSACTVPVDMAHASTAWLSCTSKGLLMRTQQALFFAIMLTPGYPQITSHFSLCAS